MAEKQSIWKDENGKASKQEIPELKPRHCSNKKCNRLLCKESKVAGVIELKCPKCGTFNYIGKV